VIDSAGHVAEAKLRATTQLSPGVLLPDSTNRAGALIDSLSTLDFPRTGVRVNGDGKIERRVIPRATKRPAMKKPEESAFDTRHHDNGGAVVVE
jgi:hypothetical protein